LWGYEGPIKKRTHSCGACLFSQGLCLVRVHEISLGICFPKVTHFRTVSGLNPAYSGNTMPNILAC
uniref:Uncharacterized protein n=1 Tax=Pelusios castaneus TaxID=367368 RepID=A0A8C8RMV7_9SAUR